MILVRHRDKENMVVEEINTVTKNPNSFPWIKKKDVLNVSWISKRPSPLGAEV